MPPISDIPIEVILDSLFPVIPVPDLLNLGCTNRFFAQLCADDTFWKRKLKEDFNFSGEGTARTSGWKFIYRGLHKPSVYTWGEGSHGRLGQPALRPRDVPFPSKLRIPGVRIVDLVAGGMSFHALDSNGHIYVWGTLDGTAGALNSDGFSEPSKSAPSPVRLELPAAIRSISCGRLHSSALDANLHIWTFLNWGRPFRLLSPMLDNADPKSTPIQIECGWTFSSVLTESGDVYVWWPFIGAMAEIIAENTRRMDAEGTKRAVLTEERTIPCIPWEMRMNPFKLPPLPALPELENSISDEDDGIKLIKIAAFDNNIIGLTGAGHVLKIGALANEATANRGRWEYLPLFSEVAQVRQHSAFSEEAIEKSGAFMKPPEGMHITHVSAQYQTFITYSTGPQSTVLMGHSDCTPDTSPTIIPDLQNKSVISVVLGDYHFGALTSTGELLTWGNYSRGALGLGDPSKISPGLPGGYAPVNSRLPPVYQVRRHTTPPPVNVPTRVRFDHGKGKPADTFCFVAAAGGWHMGALVIDLEPDHEDKDREEEDPVSRMPGRAPTGHVPLPQPPFVSHGPGQMPLMPTASRGGIFRIGYAGRGRRRGGDQDES